MKSRFWIELLIALCLPLCPLARAEAQTRAFTFGQADAGDGVAVVYQVADYEGIEINVALAGGFARSVLGTDRSEYIQLSIPGCGTTGAVGQPEMPFRGFFVEIPYGVTPSIQLTDAQVVSLGTGFRVYPAQPPLPDDGSPTPPFELDETTYSTDAFFPAEPIVMDEPGYIRGRRVVFIQVFPLRYNPVTTELQALTGLSFRLAFDGRADQAGEARKQRLATDKSELLAQALILNYEPLEPARGLRDGNSKGGSGADYLIIVGDAMYAGVLPLAEWKHRKGFATRVVRQSEVGTAAAEVRAYIQNAYNTWNPAPSYVLLVGDAEDVPPDYYSGTYSCTTDQSYACVDGSDFYPDLTIGRLPVHTNAQCVNVVSKILDYETSPDLGSWYDDLLIAAYFQDNGDGGSQGNNDGVADRWFMETAMTVYNFVINTKGWNGYTALCTTYWPLNYSLDNYHFRPTHYPHRDLVNLQRWGVSPYPDPVPSWVTSAWTSATQATNNIRNAINAGVGLVLHRDHGGETGWGDPPYYNSNVNALANGAKTPVVFSLNCLTGSFHYASGDCFCEAFIKKYPGGAVGIVGATRTSFSGYNDLIAHGICKSFWPDYDNTYNNTAYPYSMRPAEALNYAKYYMMTYEGTGGVTAGEFYMFHWFGDPEMPLRTATPQTLTVEHPDAVHFGAPSNVMVRVTRDGVPLSDALVCISHATAADHWRGLTDATGWAVLANVLPTQLDEYRIVVTERNSLPYESTMAVEYNLAIIPGDLPQFLDPGVPTQLTLQISEGQEQYVPGTGMLHYRLGGGNFLTTPIAPLGGDWYAVTLPAAGCQHDPEFYFSAQGTVSGVLTMPSNAPVSVYSAIVGEYVSLMSDNFQTDQGWTVQNSASLTAGAWERGVPVGGGTRGDPPTDYDGSGACYLTGNAAGDSDVDGGYTWLISPAIDLSAGDADVSFALWYTNNFGADPNNDLFKIYVSNNNGANWTLVQTVGPVTSSGWTVHQFSVGSFVTPTAQVKVRFEASDLNSGSVVEAAIDRFLVVGFVCDDPECFGDLDGDFDIDLADLAQLLGHYGDTGASYQEGDLDGDGDVDLSDLAALLGVYGTSCP